MKSHLYIRYGPDFDLRSLIQNQTTHPNWGNYANSLNTGGRFQFPRAGKDDDKAHPPIHPVALATNLEGDEKKVSTLTHH
jgi:DNA topoisomerase III